MSLQYRKNIGLVGLGPSSSLALDSAKGRFCPRIQASWRATFCNLGTQKKNCQSAVRLTGILRLETLTCGYYCSYVLEPSVLPSSSYTKLSDPRLTDRGLPVPRTKA